MPVSLQTKLAGKEAEITKAVSQLGIGGAMQLYEVKTRHTFLKWIRENTNGEWQLSPLSEFKGGEKAKWLREHRDTILDCLEIFGTERVKDMFCFTHDTLEQFANHSGRPYTQKLTRLERAELDAKEALCLARKLEKQLQLVNSRFAIVDEGQRKSGLRQNEMAEQVNNFEAKVANDIGGIFTQALGQGLGKFIAPAKEMLPQPPDLSIDTLVEKHRKVRKKAQRKSLGENPLVTTIARLKCDRGFKGGASHSLIVN